MEKVKFYINDHFYNFMNDWEYKFYLLIGGYGSSKSYHVASKVITKLLEEKRTALVVREVYDTIRDSCHTLLEEVAETMGVHDKLKFVTSPMQVRFPNGSKIIFRGMDKPSKLKSIHNVSLIWIEECSEVKYEGFKELLGRMRHPELQLHMILSTNPVSKSNWTYKYFFEDKRAKYFRLSDEELYNKRIITKGNIYYHHSIADDNFFLPKSYIEQLEELKLHDPDLWRIARKGQFGINGKLVLPQFETKQHDEVIKAINKINNPMLKNGMDFGFEVSYNAVIKLAVDHINKILYIYYEYYSRGKTDPEIAKDIKELKEDLIKADCEDPKTIKYFRQMGFRMYPCKKFQGSREAYTKKIKRFKRIICSEECQNTIDELKELTYAVDKNDEIIEDKFNIDPHTLSAIWYALDDYEVSDLKGNSIGVWK